MADQDWIGLMIFKNFADQDWIGFNFIRSGLDLDWKISHSAHLWHLGCIRKRISNGTGLLNNNFLKEHFLTMHLFFVLVSLQFHEASIWLLWKCFKQCINVRFVRIVYSPMVSISKLIHFKWKTITAVFHVNQGWIQPLSLEGVISVICGSQVSLRVQFFNRREIYFTTLLWQNNGPQNGLISRMLFSELY